MNSKLLYVATVAVSLLSTLAMADEAPVTRAQVNAGVRQAIANGTLQRTDYDSGAPAVAAASTTTRAQAYADLAEYKAGRKALRGPDRDRNYNPFGTDILKSSTLTHAEVNAEVKQAAANGTLQRTDYDDAAMVARRANAHVASQTFAQRVKAKFSRDHS